MELTVNWIVFSAIAIAVGASIDTRKWIEHQINIFIFQYFSYFRREMTFSWHWRSLFFDSMSPFKGCSFILIEFTSMLIESYHLMVFFFTSNCVVNDFQFRQLSWNGPNEGNSCKNEKSKTKKQQRPRWRRKNTSNKHMLSVCSAHTRGNISHNATKKRLVCL